MRTPPRSGRGTRGGGCGRAVAASFFPAGGRCPGASHPGATRVGLPRIARRPPAACRMIPTSPCCTSWGRTAGSSCHARRAERLSRPAILPFRWSSPRRPVWSDREWTWRCLPRPCRGASLQQAPLQQVPRHARLCVSRLPLPRGPVPRGRGPRGWMGDVPSIGPAPGDGRPFRAAREGAAPDRHHGEDGATGRNRRVRLADAGLGPRYPSAPGWPRTQSICSSARARSRRSPSSSPSRVIPSTQYAYCS